MIHSELIRLARDLHSIHGLMPVPVAGKVPIGGTGWNLQPFETRMVNVSSPECTGVGIQMGLVFHPVLGPVEARGLDCDIDDRAKSMLFAGTLNGFFHPTHWRWGRRPASLIFTEPGKIKREKFGPIQLLGAGKQIVYWGAYQNKSPLSTDPSEYWHEGSSIFDVQPPYVAAATLLAGLEVSVAAAGFPLYSEKTLADAVPLTADDFAMLTAATIARFQTEIKSMLFDIERSPVGSGRGTKLHHLGLKYGALIKASGEAPQLTDAAREITPNYLEYETLKKHAFLSEIGRMAEDAFVLLPGTLGQGDRRDFARGVGASMGLNQNIEVLKAKQQLPMPSGRNYPAQSAADLLRENLPPLRYLVPRFLTDSGCIVFAGKPKVGKGWIMLELALCVAEGSIFWDENCEQGEVLMYMLEDNKRRVTERLKILRPFGCDGVGNIRFRYSADGPFYVNSDGTGTLLDDIKANLRTFPRVRLIVIDVLQRVRGEERRTDNAYQTDYKIVGAIQKLSTEFGILILIVHHLKKGRVDDAIDSISGSFGVSGAADGSIIIGKEGDIMKVESQMRDIPDFEFELTKEGSNPMWKPAQTVAELMEPNGTTKAYLVLRALREAACALSAGDIAKRTNISEKNVATYLGRLMKSNQVTRPSRGWYIAMNLKYRDRVQGVIDVLKRCPKVVATNEVKAQYAPNTAPPEASYMILTAVAIREIEAGFVDGKDCLQSLKHRGLAVFNSDTTWLIGDDWEVKPLVSDRNPFAFRMPWER